ncbi:MAG TPA: TraX family protein [Thermoclostridium sp.]|nr:TraX family protein [Thermoclostridium sp.]
MKKGLNGFQLKIIACVLMTIDHIGAILFPTMLIFRLVGRLAFPIFAFFISEGFFHTRSRKKYLLRLGICAIVFQIPDWFSRFYSIIFDMPGFGVRYPFNIFSTLFLGLCAIILFDLLKTKGALLQAFIPTLIIAVLAEVIGADYGAYGVFYILLFYLTRGNVYNMIMGGVILHGGYGLYELAISFINTGAATFVHSIQIYSLCSLPIVALYNNERGRKAKSFFYIFYPVHLIVLYIIDWIR